VLFLAYGYTQGIIIPQIDGFIEGKPAAAVGLQKGDRIVKVNGNKVDIYEELITEIEMSKGAAISLLVDRNGKLQDPIAVKPEFSKQYNRYEIGIVFSKIHNPGIFISTKYAFIQTKGLIDVIIDTYKGLFQKRISLDSVGGPITIIKMSGQFAKAGIFPLFYFLAFISMNLALFNLMPFPALDGGLSLLAMFEFITGKKVDSKKVAIANYIGFIFLMTLMLVVTIKDILFPFVG
jgi:regulator of sigma E protease